MLLSIAEDAGQPAADNAEDAEDYQTMMPGFFIVRVISASSASSREAGPAFSAILKLL